MGAHADSVEARAAALEIVRTLRDRGFTAYFAGGCVRDELLGLEPTDYDVATDASPQEVRALFTRTAEVGASFGVMLVRSGPVTIEVATFRADGPYTDKRRPDEVRFADPESDAKRRDFTINALFLDPLASEDAPSIHGHVIDYVGGMDDLHAHVVRAVGDADDRLDEDHLRALRGVRLASRLGFEIEQATEAAIRHHAWQLSGVSRERIGEEIRRMMSHASRAQAAARIEALGLDIPIFGSRGPRRPLTTLSSLVGSVPVPTSLAAWAIDRGLELEPGRTGLVVDAWRAALCLSNHERDRLAGSLEILARLRAGWSSLGVAARKRLAGSPHFGEAHRLLGAIEPEAARGVGDDVADLRSSASGIAPEPLLSGEDLIGMGFAPGPSFKRILDLVYDAQLEDRVADKAGAMELARSLNV